MPMVRLAVFFYIRTRKVRTESFEVRITGAISEVPSKTFFARLSSEDTLCTLRLNN
jgi:hypothetical protein